MGWCMTCWLSYMQLQVLLTLGEAAASCSGWRQLQLIVAVAVIVSRCSFQVCHQCASSVMPAAAVRCCVAAMTTCPHVPVDLQAPKETVPDGHTNGWKKPTAHPQSKSPSSPSRPAPPTPEHTPSPKAKANTSPAGADLEHKTTPPSSNSTASPVSEQKSSSPAQSSGSQAPEPVVYSPVPAEAKSPSPSRPVPATEQSPATGEIALPCYSYNVTSGDGAQPLMLGQS